MSFQMSCKSLVMGENMLCIAYIAVKTTIFITSTYLAFSFPVVFMCTVLLPFLVSVVVQEKSNQQAVLSAIIICLLSIDTVCL